MAAMRSRHETGKTETEIEEEFEQKKQDLQANLQDQLSNTVKTFIETSTQDVVETVEKKIKERENGYRRFRQGPPEGLLPHDTVIPDGLWQ